jgi:hypothetical protein
MFYREGGKTGRSRFRFIFLSKLISIAPVNGIEFGGV